MVLTKPLKLFLTMAMTKAHKLFLTMVLTKPHKLFLTMAMTKAHKLFLTMVLTKPHIRFLTMALTKPHIRFLTMALTKPHKLFLTMALTKPHKLFLLHCFSFHLFGAMRPEGNRRYKFRTTFLSARFEFSYSICRSCRRERCLISEFVRARMRRAAVEQDWARIDRVVVTCV
ncbi:hypothetical protein BgiMline_019978 [Biomphalaria glabrata]|nr:hypothetical protein BgiMline_029709 [Biomphalaria glabrata]